MPVTANSFILLNSTPDNAAKLDAALRYLQDRSPDTARPILEAAAENQVRIIFADPKVNPHDGYGEEAHIIVWDPNAALTVIANGTAVGVQSAANGLFHEIVHSIDIDVAGREKQPNGQYDSEAEAMAVIYADAVARDCGEIQRNNYEGADLKVQNPTAHTGDNGAGKQAWTQVNSYGQTESGPLYRPGEPVPQFGYPGNEHDNDPAPRDRPDPPNNFPNMPDAGEYPGNEHDNDPPPGSFPGGGWDGGSDPSDGGAGCVSVASLLPDGRQAGDIQVGDVMQLGDDKSLDFGTGVVTYSQVKEARGYRITTESGASLVCSDTAPIPTLNRGLMTPSHLLGEQVAVRWDEAGRSLSSWEKVVKVEDVGLIRVQHITVGDRCFWAGEKRGAFILHHNQKPGGSGGTDPWSDPWWDPLKSHDKDKDHMTAHQPGGNAVDPAHLVGVPTPPVDPITFL